MPEKARKHYTYSDMELFVARAASWTARKYRDYGVEYEDACQEIRLWLASGGEKKVRRWLKSNPQQTTRIFFSMLDISRGYAEREKADKSGYAVEDVQWYSTALLEDLIPLAFDETFTGDESDAEQNSYTKRTRPPQEGNNLLVMVIDVRSGLEKIPTWAKNILRKNPSDEEALGLLLNELGGSRPYIGRRHVITNAHAQYLTKDQ